MVRVIAAPVAFAPAFPLDALVIEDDTCLVLGAEPFPRENREPPRRLLERAVTTEPVAPGTVVVRGGGPIQLHAVVHDLSLEPSWREEWVEAALRAALDEADRRRLSALVLPPLGALHGSLTVGRFAELLAAVLHQQPAGHLDAIWLVLPAETPAEALDALRGFGLVIRP